MAAARVMTHDNTAMLAVNRCDRCGGQAFVATTMRGGAKLLFCAHHATLHWSALLEQAVMIDDHRGQLLKQESAPRDAGTTTHI